MTAKQLISDLHSLGPQDLNVILHFLADRVPEAKLRTGHSLCDAADFSEWLRELADAATPAPPIELQRIGVKPAERSRFLDACPDCGHVHSGDQECGEAIGGGRKCLCERKVTA